MSRIPHQGRAPFLIVQIESGHHQYGRVINGTQLKITIFQKGATQKQRWLKRQSGHCQIKTYFLPNLFRLTNVLDQCGQIRLFLKSPSDNFSYVKSPKVLQPFGLFDKKKSFKTNAATFWAPSGKLGLLILTSGHTDQDANLRVIADSQNLLEKAGTYQPGPCQTVQLLADLAQKIPSELFICTN